ncbi:MAG: cell division protein ZapE [Pseudomonadota bacterium]
MALSDPHPPSPVQALAAAVAEGRLEADGAQAEAAEHLTQLSAHIARWKGGRGGLFRKRRAPRGLYLWGGVGTGKSLLMDLFFEAAPIRAKRRVHFHAFMQEAHAALAEERRGGGADPLPRVAARLAKSVRVLCFDEFHVVDVADAMILGRLFEGLFERGVVIVATSNRHPGELYKDGINRPLFLPFIDLLQSRLDIMRLDSGRDYRLERLEAAPVWYAPLNPEARRAMDAAFDRLTLGAKPRACALTVHGRAVDIPREAAGVARFTFEEACGRPLGPADYLLIAENFHTVMLDSIPLLRPTQRDRAARLRILVDALYEMRTKLVASAAAEPFELYPEGDFAFEFERTASRLMEMRSHDYLAAPRRTPSDQAG